MAGIAIESPANGDVITAPTTTVTIIAHGTDDKSKGGVRCKVTGTLYHKTVELKNKVADGTTRSEPANWVVVFDQLTLTDGDRYVIQITDNVENPPQYCMITFKVQAGRQITINPGLGGTTVTGSLFYVSGTATAGYAVYAAISVGGPLYHGTLINPAPHYLIKFQNVPAGQYCTLGVWNANNPPESTMDNDITVQ